MSRPRIFCDFNSGSESGGYWLGFEQSQSELEALGDELRDGTEVIIFMPDELEMAANLRFDPADKNWWADPIPGTVKYLDGTD